MSLEKKLKVKDGVTGKVLTVDDSGAMVSSDKDVNDIASAIELSNVENRVTNNEGNISNLDDRVTTLEGTVNELANQIEDINGEVVE